jgi:hypothetical protein
MKITLGADEKIAFQFSSVQLRAALVAFHPNTFRDRTGPPLGLDS